MIKNKSRLLYWNVYTEIDKMLMKFWVGIGPGKPIIILIIHNTNISLGHCVSQIVFIYKVPDLT